MVSERKIDALAEYKTSNVGDYIAAFRPDYWFKNVFTVIGMAAALVYHQQQLTPLLVPKMILALALSCLISSVGYVVNEVLDASFDALHAVKKNRPIPSGRVRVDVLLLCDAVLLLFTMIVSVLFFRPAFSILLMLYLASAAVYNMPPVRLKDKAFLDVINESVSCPIRFLIGWFSFSYTKMLPPVLLIVMLWVFGAYVMTGKRLAEIRFLSEEAGKYRESFRVYSEKMLSQIFLMGAVANMILFIIWGWIYKRQVLYSTPLVVLCFAWFSWLTIQKDSIVQQPEKLVQRRVFILLCLITLGAIFYLVCKS